MKFLEILFLILTIIIPCSILIIMLIKLDKIKKKPKYCKRLLLLFFTTLLINASLFGGTKLYNTKKDEKSNSQVDNKTDEINKNDKPIKIDDTDLSENKEPDPIDPNQNTSTTSKNTTSKGFKIEVIDGVTYIDGYLVANKTYSLPETFVPKNTYKEVKSEICQECIDKEAYSAYQTLKSDASKNGLTLWIASGYRSYSYQNGLYNSYVKRSGKDAADTYSARAGHSEHQTGLAFDLNTVNDSFATTKEGIWVNENCHKYGFIIRYPKDKSDETGYKYEPWHLRYVGVELASKLYNDGDWITLETYFGITSTYES